MATASIDVAQTASAVIDFHMAAVLDLGWFLKLEGKKLGMSFFAMQEELPFVPYHGYRPNPIPRKQALDHVWRHKQIV
jgi:hypothetical protein